MLRIWVVMEVRLVVLTVDVFVDVVIGMVMMVVMIICTISAIAIERTSVHSLCAGRRVTYVGVIRLAIAMGAHFGWLFPTRLSRSTVSNATRAISLLYNYRRLFF